ncbi:ABC transporter ATP-binding protein [Candidatus Woesearchaeota archaeon]|nr:ABC transporter ATP-binding protein [Candidatus Woesearchaeota archaeon]
MENSIIIKNIGKKYNIAYQLGGYVALREVFANIFLNPFKFVKYKVKKIINLETKEEFWALRNINLEINKGDIVGIIGASGAGKSTLLKILTGITPPTEGEVILHGKVASLLEVGTGFHPEFTGRENIFLNGVILGMTKKEIINKFDKIIEFAGIDKFIDTPVKYYSSGMYVRLAFSVAVNMEPDILLIDEVLAVGDVEFKKKCLDKLEEVAKKEGRTILFVSHNIEIIQKLCKKTILMKSGKILLYGNTEEVINHYLEQNNEGFINDTNKTQ